jgi:hypothetical protein
MNEISSKPTQRTLPSEPVILDCDHVLTYAGGDFGQLVLLCANFLYELPVYMSRLQIALKQRETLAAECAAQRVSNCLIVFGTNPITSTLETLVSALRLGRRKQAKSEWLLLQSQLDLLVPQVQRLMLEVATPHAVQ